MSYQSKYTGAQIDAGIDKANKALVTPEATLDAPRIVAINTDGTQQNLALGDGITIADGVISASGGGGGAVEYKGFYINAKFVTSDMFVFGENAHGYGWQNTLRAPMSKCTFAVTVDDTVTLTSGDAYYFDGSKVSGRITQYKPFFLTSNIVVMEDGY